MELIVISSPVPVVDEAKIINSLFESGLKFFHLRKPGCSHQDIRALLKEIDPKYCPSIALHQCHEIAADYGIDRLHLPENKRREWGSPGFTGYSEQAYLLSTSAHCLEDLYDLNGFDYVFFSPVFNSISKPDYGAVISPDFELDTKIKTKVMALGGISADNINQIGSMGFDGAAVLGALWNDPSNALKMFNDLKQEISNEKHR
ncbi:MAG: thiamine phosphate synthase [Pedobacter sp.]